MQDKPQDEDLKGLKPNLNNLVEAVVKAVVMANQTQELDHVLMIRDELHRLPDYLMTDVINDVILNLVKIDADLCRWFIIDIFLRDAEAEGKADVAERINLLIADLRSR
ncbi:MAG: hypothetical protein ACR2LR_05445 [Hassallia sp.]